MAEVGNERGLESMNNSNSALDFIFRVPKKLQFSKLYRYYFDYILRLLYRILIIDDLPDTIDETFLKLILFTQGKITFFEGTIIPQNEKQLLALNCSRSDTPNVYYQPSKVIITNPRLIKSYTLEPGKNCELIFLSEADKYNWSGINGGLWHLIERTATMLADNDISINVAQKNMRLVNLVSGDTQSTVDSINAVIAKMYEGDPNIVVKSSLIDKLQGIPILQNQSSQNLIQLIEVNQYILAHFLESIGLCTHDNMKKERLISSEINDNFDVALYNIDDILSSLQDGFDRVNAMFGTEIKIRLNPIIMEQQQEAEPEPDPEPEAEPEAAEPEASPEPEPAAEPEPEPEAEPEPEPEPEAEPEPEPEPEEITIEIEGDNNTIVIGGDPDELSERAAAAEDVDLYNEEQPDNE